MTTTEIIEDARTLQEAFCELSENSDDVAFQDYYTSYCIYLVLFLRDDYDEFSTTFIDSDVEAKRESVMHMYTFLDTLTDEFYHCLTEKDSPKLTANGKIIHTLYNKYYHIFLANLNI